MSNYTDFFPLAGGGGGGGGSEITDPTKLPLVMTQNRVYRSETPNNAFFSLANAGVGDIDSSNALNASGTPLLTTATQYSTTNATVNVTNATEATILNVTGSGYLCNVVSAVTNSAGFGTDGTLTLTIIVDGTTYTFSANPNSNTYTDNYYTRLLWGFHSKGNAVNSSSSGNAPFEGSTGYATVGMMGFGDDRPLHVSSSLPPVSKVSPSSYNNVYCLRVFGPVEFKNFNLPKLRFETSLVVKTQTNNLYTASANYTRAGASYYLDSFVM